MGAPCFDAAAHHYRMIRQLTSMHGNSYGGFIPTPERIQPDCDGGDSENPPTRNYQIKFTRLSDRQELVFPGTCPFQDGHVAFMYQFPPFSYVIGTWVNDGTNPPTTVVGTLPFADWIQGPYKGGNQLSKQSGDHLPRVLNYFSSQFRGTPEQRAKADAWNEFAFDTQKFFTSQYLLAPAKGVEQGDGSVDPVYPLHQVLGVSEIAAGTFLPAKTGGATSHFVATGFVVAVVAIQAAKLSNSPQVEILVGGEVTATITLTLGSISADVHVLAVPAIAGQSVSIRVATRATFEDSAPTTGIAAELAEIMAYKPWPHDHWLLLRMAGCRIEIFNGTDGYGIDESQSRQMGLDYFRWGMIQNVRGYASPPGSAAEINTNAVAEAARRMLRCIRILRPEQLTGYEVVNGKSVLYFNRWTTGAGGSGFEPGTGGQPPAANEVHSGDIIPDAQYQVWGTPPDDYITYAGQDYYPGDTCNGTDTKPCHTFRGVAGVTDFDVWGSAQVFIITKYLMDSGLQGLSGDTLAGIAPASQEILPGAIRWGRSYQVSATSGAVTYNAKQYTNGQRFVGAKSILGYTFTGDATVYEADGIRHTAEPQALTNEWLVGFQFKGFNNNEESLWKPDAYGRYFSFSERCHFYPNPNTPPLDPLARRHFAYGSRFWLAPEAPTGYRYASQLNKMQCNEGDTDCIDKRRSFFRSCRIYEPDLEIEKAEISGSPEGGEIKITLTGRLHTTPTAAASFGRDPNTWNSSALRTEAFRSVDNALREWLYFKATGINPSIKIGDSAANSPVFLGFDAPWGTVMPHIFLTQLIPSPYTDTNDTQDEADTPFWHDTVQQAEMYLRVICEGYVDGATSAEYGCEEGLYAVYDYTFEALCFDAFGERSILTMPSRATSLTKAKDTRPDRPIGYGPLPNTLAAAETFNLFARAINKLDTVRVILPYEFEARYINGETEINVTATNPDLVARDCVHKPGFPGVIWTGTPPGPTVSTPTAWEQADVAEAAVLAQFRIDNSSPQGYVCNGAQWTIHASKNNTEFRWKLVDPDAMEAIPPAWRSQVQTDGAFLAWYTTSIENQTAVPTDITNAATCNGSTGWWHVAGASYLTFVKNSNSTAVCGFFSNSGTISPPSLGTQTLGAGYSLGVCPVNARNGVILQPIPTDGIAMRIPLV